jgi:transposase
MKDKIFLGVDIAKQKFDVALLKDSKYKTKVFSNNIKGFAELMAWLNQHGSLQAHVCLEATGIYGDALSTYLADQTMLVSVVNPAQIKSFGQSELSRTKTDKADAKLIARFCCAMNPALWQPLPKEVRDLSCLVKRLESLNAIQQGEQNRLDVSRDIIKPSIEKIIAVLDAEIKEVKAKINSHIDDHPHLKEKKILLDSIPGVGEATIAQILSMMCTPERFATAKQLVAFAGLNPKHRQSGSSVHGISRISKTGDTTLRKALYMPAISATRHNPILKATYDSLVDSGKPKMLAVCAVMRKLLHIIYGVLKSGIPFDVDFEANRKKAAVV